MRRSSWDLADKAETKQKVGFLGTYSEKSPVCELHIMEPHRVPKDSRSGTPASKRPQLACGGS